jgi:hypothetical protein
MRVSGQCHTLSVLYPWGKDLRYPFDWRLGGPQSRSVDKGQRKNPFMSARDQTLITWLFSP